MSSITNATSQDAHRPANSERSGSWSLEVPEGAYAAVRAWTSGAAWFDDLMDALATPEGYAARRGIVSEGALLAVARHDWKSADVDTGRGVTTAHETVAADLGMSARHVQRARTVMELLGFAVTIVSGRYLFQSERQAARSAHGGQQTRAASVRALTLPNRPPVDTVYLPAPRRGSAELDGGGRKSNNNGVSAECPCGRKIRVSKKVYEEASILCGRCGAAFESDTTEEDADDE